MSAQPITVLLTCGGGPGTLAHFACLRRSTRYTARIVAADANAASGNLYLPEVDARYTVPPWDDETFLPALLNLIEAEGVDVLYSGLDEEIRLLARHVDALAAAGCRVVLPPPDTLDTAWDKLAMHRALTGIVDLPRTEALDDVTDPDSFYDAVDGRVLIKATASRGGRDIYIADDRESFHDHLAQARRAAAERGIVFVMQQRIDGIEFNVSTLHDATGATIFAACRRKFETRRIKSSTIAAVIERRDDVIDAALTAVRAIGLLPGFCNVELIVDAATGRPTLIEINGGRTAAQDMNLVAAGLNLTEMYLDLALGRPVAPVPHPRESVASLKIRSDVIVDYADVGAVPAAAAATAPLPRKRAR